MEITGLGFAQVRESLSIKADDGTITDRRMVSDQPRAAFGWAAVEARALL